MLLVLLFLILAVIVFINTEFGQNWIAKKVTSRLSRDLKTHIVIDRVSLSLFNKLNLKGVYIEDQKKDTLLAAGVVQVRITDWFFLKNNIELKYIGLEDAVVHLNRTDSVWNYAFIQDYFFPASTSSSSRKGVELDLKELSLKNVVFDKKDAWLGQNMAAKIGGLKMLGRDIDFTNKAVDINTLILDKPYFSIYNYPRLKPSEPDVASHETEPEPAATDSSLQWNPGGWIVKVGQLKITDGVFKNDRQTEREAYDHFDGAHLAFQKINAEFKDLKLNHDTLTAGLELNTEERSGFTVKSMKAHVKFHPRAMEFSDLDIHTNKSEIRDYFAMNYKDFSDMNDFIHKIRMEGNFKNAQIDTDDIAYFAPELSTWQKRISMTGRVQGSVDDLNADDLIMQAGNNTYLNGDISLAGLPNINQTFIDFKANDFRTNYNDAVRFVPSLRNVTTPDLARLGYIHFNGSFTGFVRDFVTYGTIQTNLGTVTSDVNMKFPAGDAPSYSGNLSTRNFQLGQFIHTSQISDISFDGVIKGRGFRWNTLQADIKGKINEVTYNGYRYTQIETNARLDKKLFDGFLTINDPNAELVLNGIIDFNEKVPNFNLVADVRKANLQTLHLTKEDLSFNGKFNLDFAGDNIDNFSGTARISEAALFKGQQQMSFDSLYVSSTLGEDSKTFRAQSNEFDITVNGDYNFRDLPDAFQLFLNKYYPAYIKKPKRQLENENLAFDITTRNLEEYIKLINPNISGFNNSHIRGTLDLLQNNLSVDAEVPYFAYKNYSFSNTKLNGDGNLEKLILTGTVSNTTLGDSLYLPETSFRVETENDVSLVNVSTSANRAIKDASLSARVDTYSDGVKIIFDPTSFVINGKTWNIEKGGELEFRTNSVAQGELVLRESFQELRVYTVPSSEGNWNDVDVILKNINIGDFSPYISRTNRFEGLLSGSVKIEDPYRQFNVIADLEAQEFRLDDDSLGRLKADFVYDNKSGELRGKGANADTEHKIDFDALIYLKDSLKQKDDRISLTTQNFPVKPLERFIGNLFSDLQGYATGKLDILGEGDYQKFVGRAKLHDAGLKVNFTQVFYKIDDTEIVLKEDEIDFGTLTLRDRYGKTATLHGSIRHHAWKDMFFDINARIDGEPMEVLNTGFLDNKNFYGNARASGSFSLTGPQSRMYMSIYAKASETDSSRITIPSTDSRESGIADFLVERKYGHEMTTQDVKTLESDITYDVDLVANPMVTVQVILDEQTGDIIKGRGTGTLNIHAGTSEDLSIRGRYDIEEGSYLFTFQSFFKKPFEIKKDASNYIEWTGDPYKANINFTAIYKAEEVSFAPLARDLGIDRIKNVREDVYVVVTLTEDLFRPKFNFKLEFPQNSLALNDPSLAFSIQQIQNNLNELNKQVTYLIVFNSFAPLETGSTAATGTSAFNEFAYNTISGLFFNEVNKRLNQLLAQILKNNDLKINFSGSLYNRNLVTQTGNNSFNINQGNFNVTVGQSFFDDRFTISVGSTLDVPLQSQSSIQQTIQFLPDVTAEWLINKSGTIRATFFYRENLDFITGTQSSGAARSKRAGASLAYRKEFNKLGDLFRKKKPQRNPVPVKDSVNASSAIFPPRNEIENREN